MKELLRLLLGGKTTCPRCGTPRAFWIMFGGPGVCNACGYVLR